MKWIRSEHWWMKLTGVEQLKQLLIEMDLILMKDHYETRQCMTNAVFSTKFLFDVFKLRQIWRGSWPFCYVASACSNDLMQRVTNVNLWITLRLQLTKWTKCFEMIKQTTLSWIPALIKMIETIMIGNRSDWLINVEWIG